MPQRSFQSSEFACTPRLDALQEFERRLVIWVLRDEFAGEGAVENGGEQGSQPSGGLDFA